MSVSDSPDPLTNPQSINPTDTTPAGPHMVKELVVQNKLGIHARPAAMIVRITNKFKAEVFVEKDEERSEEHTSELQSLRHLVCRLLLEKKNKKTNKISTTRTLIESMWHTPSGLPR